MKVIHVHDRQSIDFGARSRRRRPDCTFGNLKNLEAFVGYFRKILTACAAGAAMFASVSIAHADGTVVVYSAAPQQMMDEMLPAFEKKTGTKVELVKAGSGELMNRIKAESGKPAGDVIWSVDGTVIDFNAALFQPMSRRKSPRSRRRWRRARTGYPSRPSSRPSSSIAKRSRARRSRPPGKTWQSRNTRA